MYETLQLIGSVVAGGFIIVIGIWVAWLMGSSLYRKDDIHAQRLSGRQFDKRPFDDRPFNGDNDVANDGG